MRPRLSGGCGAGDEALGDVTRDGTGVEVRGRSGVRRRARYRREEVTASMRGGRAVAPRLARRCRRGRRRRRRRLARGARRSGPESSGWRAAWARNSSSKVCQASESAVVTDRVAGDGDEPLGAGDTGGEPRAVRRRSSMRRRAGRGTDRPCCRTGSRRRPSRTQQPARSRRSRRRGSRGRGTSAGRLEHFASMLLVDLSPTTTNSHTVSIEMER